MFPFAAVAVSLVDFGVGATVLVGMLAYYHVAPWSGLLLLPVILAVHIAFTAALALLLAMANLFYRDVKYLFDVLLMVWMFASATVYPSEALGPGILGWIVRANPMTIIIDAYREVILYGSFPAPVAFASVAVTMCVLMPAAWLTFHRLEFQFAEYV
jgi:homopolymeric O-antigen transport system permease protein